MKKSIYGALLLSTALLLGACGEENADQNKTPKTAEKAQAESTTTSNSSSTVDEAAVAELVKNFPEQKSEKIITTSVTIAEMLKILNVTPTGLPTTEHQLPEGYDKIDKIGSAVEPDVEKIVSLSPDLVVGPKSIHTSLEKKMKNTKIPTAYVPTDSYGDLKNSFMALATALDQKEVAEKYLTDLDKKEKEIIASNDSSNKKVMVLFGSGESFMLMNTNTYVGSLVAQTGAKNIVTEATTSKEAYVPMNMEDVVATNPDVILLVSHSDASVALKQFKDEVKKNGAWEQLNAFKNDQVDALDYGIFGYASIVKAPEALEALQKMLAK